VENGDTPREALILLFEALTGYVESARKMKGRPEILNQRPDREYKEIWREIALSLRAISRQSCAQAAAFEWHHQAIGNTEK